MYQPSAAAPSNPFEKKDILTITRIKSNNNNNIIDISNGSCNMDQSTLSFCNKYNNKRLPFFTIFFFVCFVLTSGSVNFSLCAAASPSFSAVVPRPAVMRFVTPIDVRTPMGESDMAVGIEAAFYEANETGVLGSTKLVHEVVDAMAAFVATDFYNTSHVGNFLSQHNNFSEPDFYGFVGASLQTTFAFDVYHAITRQPQRPSFGPRLYINQLNTREYVSLRGNAISEWPFIFDFALHRKDVHCTDFIFLYTATIETHVFFPQLIAAMKNAGYPDMTFLERPEPVPPAGPARDAYFGAYMGTITAALIAHPHACICYLDYYQLAPLFLNFIAITMNQPYRQFFTYSLLTTGPFAHMKTVAGNLYASSFIPNYMNESLPVIKKARAAVQGAIARNTTKPASLYPYLNTVIGNSHIEGYIIGRMVVDIIRSTMNVTKEELVNTAYRTRLSVDDFTLSPLSDQCQQGFELPCFCNVASKAYYMTRGNSTDGDFYELQDIPENGEVKLTRRSAPISECLGSGVAVRRPFNVLFVTFNDTNPTISTATAAEVAARVNATLRLEAAMRNGLNVRNRDAEFSGVGGLHIVPRGVANYTDGLHGNLSSGGVGAVLSQAEQRYLPFAVFGGDGLPTSRGLRLDALPASLRLGEEYDMMNTSEMTTTTMTNGTVTKTVNSPWWHANAVHLEPSLAHYLHAHAANINGDAAVIADSNDMALLAERSLNTFGHRATAAVVVNDAATLSTAATLLRNTLAGSDGRVLVASLQRETLRALLTAAEAATTTTTTTSSTSSGGLYIATHETILQDALQWASLGPTARLAAGPNAPSVYFTSIHDAWWESSATGAQSNALAAAYGGVRNTTDVAVLRGLYYAEATYALAQGALDIGAGATALQAASKISSFSAAGVGVGPVFGSVCVTAAMARAPTRQCQCNTGPRRFMLHALSDWLLRRAASTASTPRAYSLEGCTISYTPLPSAATDRTTMIIGATAGSAGALVSALVGLVVFVSCCMGRSHRTAPKDMDQPFAIVFTDIQSSTSLWARIPAIMSTAVDQHHALIRKLIAQHKGYEVKTVGDSFMVAFKDVQHATALAVAIQREFLAAPWPAEIDSVYTALATEKAEEKGATLDPIYFPANAARYASLWKGLRVRVGVHLGPGTITKDETTGSYDYYGTVVNTAARIEGVGHGGQVLLSKDAYDAMSTAFFSNTLKSEVKPLGPQPLRGLDVPLSLYEIAPVELREREFDALRLDVDHAIDPTITGGANHSNSASDQHSQRPSQHNPHDDQRSARATEDNNSSTGINVGEILTAGDAISRHAKRGVVSEHQLQNALDLVNLMFAATPTTFQNETSRVLLKRWHVPRMKTVNSNKEQGGGGGGVNRRKSTTASHTSAAGITTAEPQQVDWVNLLAKILSAQHHQQQPPASATPSATQNRNAQGPDGAPPQDHKEATTTAAIKRENITTLGGSPELYVVPDDTTNPHGTHFEQHTMVTKGGTAEGNTIKHADGDVETYPPGTIVTTPASPIPAVSVAWSPSELSHD